MMSPDSVAKPFVKNSSVLVVGAGSIGKRHMRNLRALGYSQFHAFRTNANAIKPDDLGIEVQNYLSMEAALQQKPGIAVISNPTSCHIEPALAAAKSGCHIFLEKPVSNSLDGTEELTKEVKRQGLTVAVGYNLRFHPAMLAARENLLQREIGEVLSVRAWAGQYLPDWHPHEDYRQSYMAKTELGGGVIFTLSHEIDCLYWLFGSVREVSCSTARARSLQMETESVAEITMTFDSGLLGQVHLDCLQRKPRRGYEFTGTEGTLTLNLIESTITIDRPSATGPEIVSIPQPDPNNMYLDEMSDFVKAIESGNAPRVSLEDGIAVLKIALAAHRSAASGRRESCK